jgi:type I restriction enzyme M protein
MERTADRIPELTRPVEERLHDAFDDWWHRHAKRLLELPETGRVMDTRAELLDSFVGELEPLGILDRFQLAGAVASWWGEVQYDFKTLAFHKFSGVVQGWITTIQTAFAEDGEDDVKDKQRLAAEKRKAREHRVVPVLLPDYLNELEEAEAYRAELDARLKAATPPVEDEDTEPIEELTPAELKQLKADLAAAKRRVRALEGEFVDRLVVSASRLDHKTETDLVLRIFKADVQRRLDSRVAEGRRALIDTYLAWAAKYAVTLPHLEGRCDAAAARLHTYLERLGYA